MTLREQQRIAVNPNPLVPGEILSAWEASAASTPPTHNHATETTRLLPIAPVAPLVGLSIFTLGGFSVTRHYASGEQYDVPSAAWRHGRALALAQYLLARPGFESSRETIREALWPRAEPRTASAYLSNTIWNVRRALGVPRDDASVLCVTESLIRLNVIDVTRTGGAYGSGVWLDILAFDAEMKRLKSAATPLEQQEAAQRALALYRGDFLPYCTEPHWRLAKGERYRELWALALLSCARAQIALQDGDAAMHTLHTLLASMPDHEEGAALALSLLMEQKRPREARALYEHIRSAYRRQFRQEPPRNLKQIVGSTLPPARTTIPLPRNR